MFDEIKEFVLPLFEIGVNHPIGETFTTNTDALKYTIASQLMHYQMCIDYT
jgi:hypothetical protein